MKWQVYLLVLLCCTVHFRALAVEDDTSRKTLHHYNELFYEAFEKGENYKAREYAARALIVALKRGQKRDIAIVYSNLAIINARMGDYEKANQYNLNSLRIFTELNDTLHIARCNLNIGSVFIELKEYSKALSYIEDARDSFYEINDRLGYSICMSNIGSVYLALEDYKTALPIFFEAVEIDERNNDPSGTSSNFLNIAIVYLNLKNYTAAGEYLRKALAIDMAMGDRSGIASAQFNGAKLMLAAGKSDSALYLCRKSILMFRETGQLSDEANALQLLAEIYGQTGDYRLAYSYHMKASDLSDSLMNLDKVARIGMLEEKYINEKLKGEILSLEYRSRLQETRIENQRKLIAAWLTGFVLSVVAMAIIVVQLRKKNNAYKFIVHKNIDLMKKERELGGAVRKLGEAKQELELLKSRQEVSEAPVPEGASDDKTRPALSGDERKNLLLKLHEALVNDKLYTKADLTVEKLAKKLSTNRTYLSQLINEEFQKGYSDLINEYRIREAMSLLSDPVSGQRYSIDAIARESGFNNISNFNMLFRKHVGTTPSVFRKNAHSQ